MSTPETDIIREAEAVSELTIDEMMSQKFESPLACALFALTMNGYSDDEVTDGERVIVRIDRWTFSEDNEGFVTVVSFDTEEQAIAAVTAIATH